MSNTKKKSSVLFVLRLIKMAVTVVTLSLSAKYFGVSVERDVWILSYSTLVLIDMMIWGPVNETFRTKFIQIKETSGQTKALKQAKSLFLFTNVATLIVFLLIYFFAESIAKGVAPGASSEKLSALTLMIQILAPSILLHQVNNLMTGILNAYDIFFVPEIAGFVAALINIVCLLIFAPHMGIYALVTGYYLSMLLLFGMLVFQFNKNKIPLMTRPYNMKWENIKIYIMFALPYFVPYFFGQFNGLIEKAIASFIGTGMVSMIDYARKIVDVPSSVLVSVLATILVPLLSKNFINKNSDNYNKEFSDILKMGILFFGAFLVFIIISSKDLTSFLFDKGNISKSDLSIIATLTWAYAISALGIFFYQIFSFALLSSNQLKFAAFWGIAPQILMTGFNVFFYDWIGVWIFPVSLFVAHILTAAIYVFRYPFKLEHSQKAGVLKYLLVLMVLASCSFAVRFLVTNRLNLGSVINLIIEGLLAVFIVLLAVFIFSLEEVKYLKLGIIKAQRFLTNFKLR